MFLIRGKKNSGPDSGDASKANPATDPPGDSPTAQNPEPQAASPAAPTSLFGRLKSALHRTRGALVQRVTSLFSGRTRLDDDLVEELETLLLTADVGVDATERIIAGLRAEFARTDASDGDAVVRGLRTQMLQILAPVSVPLEVTPGLGRPFVVLVVGVNGTGKTTSIAKLAHRFKSQGLSVMLAAGDTFRAAAIEQLQAWGERAGVPVVAQHTGADSASVVYDALESARARGIDVLIADTAGRLHTQSGLMEELKKVRRVISKLDDSAPHETLLVIDAGTGQNALVQASQFHDAVAVSGIALTKLDGTAKGGIIFALADRLGLPIRFIGVGEGLEDLRDFEATAFIDALFDQ